MSFHWGLVLWMELEKTPFYKIKALVDSDFALAFIGWVDLNENFWQKHDTF